MQQRGSKLGVPSVLTSANATTVVLVQYQGRNVSLVELKLTLRNGWPLPKSELIRGRSMLNQFFYIQKTCKACQLRCLKSIEKCLYQQLEEASMLYALLP